MRTTRERADLLETLARRRWFLRFTSRDLTDARAAPRTTASSLCLGGLIKHVAATETSWMRFITNGADGMHQGAADWDNHFEMLDGDTLAGLLERYAQVASRTTAIIESLPDLDADQALPPEPWFEPGRSEEHTSELQSQ